VPPDDEERRRLREALVFSDARYQALITHLDDLAIVLFDHDLRLQLVDGERLRRDGLDLRAFEGRRFEDVLPPERYARVADEYRAVLRGEHRAFLLETPDDAPDYWVDAVPIRDEEGRIAGGMAIGLDITERRRAERALEDRARELERSNEELEQFAYVASHDLSEPLRMVSSYLQLLRRRYHGRLDQDADEFIEFAVDGATRMRALIEDLLAYSRAGRADRPLEPVDLGEVVGRVVDDLHAAGITLVATVAQLPTVPGDPAQLHQLFANLLGNACKFVAPGRIPAVSVHVLPGEGHWRFVVDDNGIGFDPDHVDRMFRMFQRLHTREAYAGTGIGLAIAKKVVERHGGEIAAFPRPEGGSRFTFTLPVEGP
jgi:PAS domain S-box-containing protein